MSKRNRDSSNANPISSAMETSTGTTRTSFPENFRSKLKQEWLDSCTAELNISNPGFDNFDLAEKEKLIFQRFLFSDMRFSCRGTLPKNTHTFDLAHHPDPLVLQVNQMGHINHHPENRRLLTMTDGVEYTLGVEIRPIKDVQVSAPAGFKVCSTGMK
ncbi:recQ-mediated genome instability protein 1-like isoform X1 [Papaver somniferum]|uniref:recQ-mediated genome instability protein 1-like isoform X1 n=1 Tax=Papaver somniferum TaxID=3469 RepID=UPI000E6F5DC2|nr:recQ-mediated genome instability protein 1-like isoform X1 [Papaver somniferum]